MSEQSLSVANVAGVVIDGDCGGAAQVVGHDVTRDAYALLEASPRLPEHFGRGARRTVAGLGPQLTDEGLRVAQIAVVEEFFKFCGDWQGDVFVALCDESQLAALWVVVTGADARGGADANGEVGAKENPEAQERARGCDECGAFVVCDGDVSRPDTGVTRDVAIELGRAVILPQKTKEGADFGGLGGARGEC